jgi:hypothetical protein
MPIGVTNKYQLQPIPTSLITSVTAKNIDQTKSDESIPTILVRSDEIQNLDVLSGRGGKSNHHPGNKIFRKLVSEIKQAYRSSPKNTEKRILAESIIEKIHRMGGQFLIQNKKCLEPQWRVMTELEACRKVCQALREERKLQWTSESLPEKDCIGWPYGSLCVNRDFPTVQARKLA